MDFDHLPPVVERATTRCLRAAATADRGWKATVLGVVIVAAVALVP